ncbi:hypothetical protein NL676_027175 [Syzygium grande]|nr:hypothetical protein NL676_027175 [Syzygium grande]
MGNENEMENVIDDAVMCADVNEFRRVRARSDRVGEPPLLRSSGGAGASTRTRPALSARQTRMRTAFSPCQSFEGTLLGA